MLTGRQQGVALITSLMALVLVFGIAMLMMTRSLGEIQHSKDNAAVTQTLLLAQAGARFGNSILQGAIQEDVRAIVLAKSAGRAETWAFGDGDDDGEPKPKKVAQDLKGLAASLQSVADKRLCDESFSPDGYPGKVELRFYVTREACGGKEKLPNDIKLTAGRYVAGAARTVTTTANGIGLQTYAIPFVLVSTGTFGEYERRVVIQGEYRFNEGTTNFARFAYFTNMDAEQNLYFTDSTVIDGPTHTNSNLRFSGDPWFGGEVTSAGCQFDDDNGDGDIDPDEIKDDLEKENGVDVCKETKAGAHFLGFYNWDTAFLSPDAMSPNASNPKYRGWDLNGYYWYKRTASQPQLTEGVDWDADYIALPENNQDQRNAAIDGVISYTDSDGNTQTVDTGRKGLYFPTGLQVHSLELWAADEDGNALEPDGKKSSGEPRWDPADSTYQRIRACFAPLGLVCNDYRVSEQTVGGTRVQTIEIYNESACAGDTDDDGWSTDVNSDCDLGDERAFNGVIFSEGDINRITGPRRSSAGDPDSAPPAIARFSEITLASDTGDLRITGDLKYEDPPLTGTTHKDSRGRIVKANVVDLEADNVLGIYSQEGSILVGNQNVDPTLNAPDDINVHASLMTSEGQIKVENYRFGVHKGDFNLLGGMIQHTRGAFGTFNTRTGTGSSGFSRVYTYDQRFRSGTAPPYFPTTNNLRSVPVWPITFVEREQVF